jgi:uncharacterized protein (DUF1330 family)
MKSEETVIAEFPSLADARKWYDTLLVRPS